MCWRLGLGPGGLTRGLLAVRRRAPRVLAVEKDARCLPALAEVAAAYPGQSGRWSRAMPLQIDPLTRLTPPIKYRRQPAL